LGPELAAESATAADRFIFGDKSVEFDALELRVREQVFPLTLMEANVLRYLIQHEGKPVSRKQMLEEVWDCTSIPIPARSIISSCGSGGMWKTIRRTRAPADGSRRGVPVRGVAA